MADEFMLDPAQMQELQELRQLEALEARFGGGAPAQTPAAAAPISEPSMYDSIAEGISGVPVIGAAGHAMQIGKDIYQDPSLLKKIPLSILNGLTFQGGDEIAAAGNAAIDAFSPDVGFSDAYTQRLDEARGLQREFSSEEPGADFLLQTVGGVGGIAKTGLAGLGRTLSGAAALGAGTGAAAGFLGGEGGAGNRTVNSLLPAALGAALGAGGHKLTAPRTSTGDAAIDLLKKSTKDIPDEKLLAASKEMADAAKAKSPLLLQEAIDDPQLYAEARTLATRPEGRRQISGALQQRTNERFGRLEEILDDVAPEKSVFEGAKAAVGKAGEVIKAAETARTKITTPLYQKAFQGGKVESEDLTELMKDSYYLKEGINRAKRFKEYSKLPDTHIKVLDKAKQFMDDRIEKAVAQGEKSIIRSLTDEKNQLLEILDKANPDYQAARDAFSSISPEVSKLAESQLGVIKDLADDKVPQAINKIFSLEPERIKELREVLGKDTFKSLTRAYIQDIFEKTRDRHDAFSKLIGSEKAREKLKIALGDSFDGIFKKLAREQKIHLGSQKLGEGSPTHGYGVLAKELDENLSGSSVDLVRHPIRWVDRNITQRLAEAIRGAQGKPDMARDLANIYSDPVRGQNALAQILAARLQKTAPQSRTGNVPLQEQLMRALIVPTADQEWRGY